MTDPDDFPEAVERDVASLYEHGISTTLVRSQTPALAEFAEFYLGFPKEPLWKSAVTLLIDAADEVEHSRLATDGIVALYGIDPGKPAAAPTMRAELRNQNAAPSLKQHGGKAYASGDTLRKAKIKGEFLTDFVHRLVAAEIVQLAHEREFVYTGQYAKPATVPPRANPKGHKRRIAIVLVAGLTLILLSAIIFVIARTGDEGNIGLPQGTVVDARNGRIVEHPDLRNDPPGSPGVAGGDMLRVCNDSTGECDLSKWVAARPGDQIRFRFRIHNPMRKPLPYAKFFAHSGMAEGKHRNISLNIEIRWPALDYTGQFMNSNSVSVRSLPSSKKLTRLRYVPKFAILANKKGEKMTTLPDGITDGGIALANIGSPPDCYVCDLEYVRYVEFSMVAE